MSIPIRGFQSRPKVWVNPMNFTLRKQEALQRRHQLRAELEGGQRKAAAAGANHQSAAAGGARSGGGGLGGGGDALAGPAHS